MFERK